jgi:hypothetical protein
VSQCIFRGLLWLTFAMCTSLLLPFGTRAETYSFTEIADTSQFTQGFGAYGPAINNAGEVAFKAFWDSGGQGIFT